MLASLRFALYTWRNANTPPPRSFASLCACGLLNTMARQALREVV